MLLKISISWWVAKCRLWMVLKQRDGIKETLHEKYTKQADQIETAMAEYNTNEARDESMALTTLLRKKNKNQSAWGNAPEVLLQRSHIRLFGLKNILVILEVFFDTLHIKTFIHSPALTKVNPHIFHQIAKDSG